MNKVINMYFKLFIYNILNEIYSNGNTFFIL